MNNLYQQLNKTQTRSFSPSNDLKNFISIFKNSSNPQQLLNNIIKSNPQMQSMYALIQNSGKSPKELFYSLSKEKGIDPQSIIKLF